MTSPHGVEVGAVHGFLRDVATLLQQYSPTYLICAFDASEDTFRNTLYPQYKAHREEMPEALRGQLGIIQDALRLIPSLSIVGFEADDILATIAHRADLQGCRVLLVTSDKDCRQLITPRVSMLNLRKNELFTAKELMDVWAIRPDQVVDFQAMVGDSTDNVPGVHSIGPKAAQQLLQQFGSLDAIYENIEKVPGVKKREKLLEHGTRRTLSGTWVSSFGRNAFAGDKFSGQIRRVFRTSSGAIFGCIWSWGASGSSFDRSISNDHHT
jgi:DNA polymerase-1